jgi:hypothetical protein
MFRDFDIDWSVGLITGCLAGSLLVKIVFSGRLLGVAFFAVRRNKYAVNDSLALLLRSSAQNLNYFCR